MSAGERSTPPRVGHPAPDFTLPRVEREGIASLAEYRGRSGLLLIINRGLWCSFCRRYLVQVGEARERLRELGVEILAIVASDLERSRLYVRYRPMRVPLAADPDRQTHGAYGVPMSPLTPEIEETLERLRGEPVRIEDLAVNPADLAELGAAVKAAGGPPAGGTAQPSLWDFILMQRQLYPYELSDSEQQEWARSRALGTGQFLIDRDGVLRWKKLQSTVDPPAGLGHFASEADLLAAVGRLTG